MNPVRTLIVDDEPLARERLRRLLAAEGDRVLLVGECGSGPAAVARLAEGDVDLLFLDMEMPGASGLQVLKQLDESERPAVIFATAHESFALDAFELQAVDYLLKPFDQERFRVALRRAEEWLRLRSRSSETGAERMMFKVDGRVLLLKPDDIVRVEAADNYVVLHLAAGERPMIRETMTAIEKRLGAKFVRVNRSALVHADRIKELQPGLHGDYILILHDGTRLPLSRSLRGKLNELFGPSAT